MPVISITGEAESGRIVVHCQQRQKVSKTPSQPKAGYSGACLGFQACKEA
jgi:hypothetical protein